MSTKNKRSIFKKFSRKAANKKLLKQLEKLINKYPEQRFGQILENFGFYNQTGDCADGMFTLFSEFYTEPEIHLKQVQQTVKQVADQIKRQKPEIKLNIDPDLEELLNA